jgi:hypothetical protein
MGGCPSLGTPQHKPSLIMCTRVAAPSVGQGQVSWATYATVACIVTVARPVLTCSQIPRSAVRMSASGCSHRPSEFRLSMQLVTVVVAAALLLVAQRLGLLGTASWAADTSHSSTLPKGGPMDVLARHAAKSAGQ